MLGVEMHTTIKTLFSKGYNKSQIANLLDTDRKTVRKVLKELDDKGIVERKKRTSILDEYKYYINAQVAKDLSAKRIYQDIVRDMDYMNLCLNWQLKRERPHPRIIPKVGSSFCSIPEPAFSKYLP